VILTVFMVVVLLASGLLVGNIIREVIQGEEVVLSDIEVSVIIAAVILSLEMTVVSIFTLRKKKVDIKEMVKEARKGTY